MNQFPSKNYFTMPNEIFSLGLDASEIAVYAYLRCLESRKEYGHAIRRRARGERSHLY